MSWRWRVTGNRLTSYGRSWPRRGIRLLRWLLWLDRPSPGRHQIPRWGVGILALTLDLTPLAWVAETLFLLLDRDHRPLTEEERRTLRAVYASTIPPGLITVAEHSRTAHRFRALAFVTFQTIHAARPLSAGVFVHELMHCLQYLRMGSRYMPEALWAQRWGGGYAYRQNNLSGAELTWASLNVEQQAQAMEDLYEELSAANRPDPFPAGRDRDLLIRLHREMLVG